MAKRIQIKHTSSGMVKTGYYGFSWTYLLFGWFVPLFRGELGIGALHLLFTMITLGLWQFIVCFLYNKQYMTRMLTNGWVLSGSDDENRSAGLVIGVSSTN
jgi:hypothetical protein